MDTAKPDGAELLEAIADANEKLLGLARTLRNRAEVREVVHDLDCRYLRSGVTLEYFVDAELMSGQALSWGIEVTWEQATWIIETGVRMTGSQGQYPVRKLATRSAANIPEFIQELSEAAESLITTTETINLADY